MWNTERGAFYLNITEIKLVEYSRAEERVNSASHAAGLILSALIVMFCLLPAVREGNTLSIVCASLYLFGITVMFIGSALYHAAKPGKAKKILRVLDHCMIFFAVAGTAAGCVPAVYDTVGTFAAVLMLIAAWTGAVFGLIVTLTGFEKRRGLQLAVYIITALVCAVCGGGAYFRLPIWAFFAFLGGSGLLIAGIIIYGLGRTRKWYHSVFHFFILGGLFIYWFGIAEYCY